MKNQKMHMSAMGRNKLQIQEKLEMQYYSDNANDCTFGIGTFVHYGPCTQQELNKTVTKDQVYSHFFNRIHDAERTVKHYVTKTSLSQDQFDALVSYTYNTGATIARHTLETANRGDFAAVVKQMKSTVYLHRINKNGHKLPPQISHGLINRRREETKPFEVVR